MLSAYDPNNGAVLGVLVASGQKPTLRLEY